MRAFLIGIFLSAAGAFAESPEAVIVAAAPTPPPRTEIEKFCDELAKFYEKNKWGDLKCEQIPFKVFGKSHEGRPLVLFETSDDKKKKLTVIQCGIHGDELPSTPMCFSLIDEMIQGKHKIPSASRVVVQPLLNPDGMFRDKPTRHNARGVDINRNFPTKDWARTASKSWAKKDRSDPRKFPGEKPNSEPETQALVEFIASEKPQKIISVHTPLGFLDLDSYGNKDKERRAQYLAVNMSKNAGDYKFKRFGFYPGSLGNYAGRERGIPVYTLELPPVGTAKATLEALWGKFRIGLWRAVDFDLETGRFFED